MIIKIRKIQLFKDLFSLNTQLNASPYSYVGSAYKLDAFSVCPPTLIVEVVEKLDHNEMVQKCETEKNRKIRGRNLIRVTESECLKMLTTLALLSFREVPFAHNEKSILEKGSKRRNSPEHGRHSYHRNSSWFLFVLCIIAHRKVQIVRNDILYDYIFLFSYYN